MRCTVVVDNLAVLVPKKPFVVEHGFSLLIENQGEKILFDAGYSQALLHNLELLDINPREIDKIILSHGHYDHAGGLYFLLQQARKKYPFYSHPDIFRQRYSFSSGTREDIGIPYTKERLASMGAQWRFSKDPVEISTGLWFSGEIPRTSQHEPGDKNLIASCDGAEGPDDFADDAALYYDTGNGLVVIGGCAHAGLVNTVKYGFEVTNTKRLAGWIGGTHLGPATGEQQEYTTVFLEEQNPDFIMAGHCTGFTMMAELKKRFVKRFIPSAIGQSIEF